MLKFFTILFLLFISSKPETDTIKVSSPDHNFQIEFHTDQSLLFYRVFFQNKLIIENSSLGFELSNTKNIFSKTKVKTITKKSVDQ